MTNLNTSICIQHSLSLLINTRLEAQYRKPTYNYFKFQIFFRLKYIPMIDWYLFHANVLHLIILKLFLIKLGHHSCQLECYFVTTIFNG